MIIFLQELVLQLFLWSLKLIDGIMEMFATLTGIATVTYKGEQLNLLELCLTEPTVSTIFWCIFILSIGLTCIFSIIAIVKNMVSNNKTLSSIVGSFFMSILGTLAIISVVILAILISNSILYMVADIFKVGTNIKLSSAIFNSCVSEYLNGYSISEINIYDLKVKDIFGDYKTAAFGIWPTSWEGNGMVNPDSFMYISCILSSICLPLALLVAAINLSKRLFEIVYMYLVMPISLATLSLDEGNRFKAWRESFASRILIAYGTVFSVNVFIILTPILSSITLDGLGDFANSIFTILILIGGSMVIPAGQDLFIRLFAPGEDLRAGGSGFVRGFMHGSRMTVALPFIGASKIIGGSYHMISNSVEKKHEKKYREERENNSDRQKKVTK